MRCLLYGTHLLLASPDALEVIVVTHSLTDWSLALTWLIPFKDLTDVTPAIEDTDKDDEDDEEYEVIKWRKLSSEESYQVMKVIKWSKLSSDESYQVMKVI